MSSGATGVWTRAMQAAITWRAFIAWIVTWPRARHANENPNPSPRGGPPSVQTRPQGTPPPPPELTRYGGRVLLRVEGDPANVVRDLRIVDGSLRVQPAVAQAPVVQTMQVTTTPVMEVRRLLNDDAVKLCREAGREELVEYAWLARFEHEGTRHDQCASGPLKAIRNSSHEMLRCKVLPEHGPRVVLVQMVKDGEVVYAFELDVAKPAWMVTARQCVEDALG